MDEKDLQNAFSVLQCLQIQDWEEGMKIDLDIIRSILMAVTDSDELDANINTGYVDFGYPAKDVSFNAKELLRYGMIEAVEKGRTPDGKYPNYRISDLLPPGGAVITWISDKGRTEILKNKLADYPEITLDRVYFWSDKLFKEDVERQVRELKDDLDKYIKERMCQRK